MFYGRYLEPVEIGAGSFGTVYQALEPKVGRYVALKESACGKSSSASILVQRMKAEYELIKQLKHDNIVPVFDFIASEDGYVIISMELASGGSLREMLRKNRFRLYESTVRTYAKAALRGLEYLHGRGVLHCDIKPENLVLNGATLKLCDFGLSKQCRGTSADGHRTMNISGTPRYMAPELWDTNTYTQASDIWALGCTLAELATGCSPWEGSIKKDAHDFAVMFFVHGLLSNPAAYDPNKIVPGHLSRPFRQMLHGMLSLDATQRPTATQCLQSVYFEENEGWRDEEGIEDEDTYDEQLMKAHSTPAGSKDFTFSVDEGSPTSTTTESQTTKALGSVASIPAVVAQSTVVHFSDALTTRTSARRSTATLPPTERSQPTSEVMRAPQIATADAEVVEPMWVFQNGRQVVQYDDQAQKLIEAAFQAKQETVEVATIRLLDGLMGRYEINFAKMRQRNMATGYLRKVERWTCAKKPELLRKANRRGFTEESQKSK